MASTYFARHGDILINFSAGGGLSPAEFAEWLERLREPGVKNFLSCAVGPVGMSSVQRRQAGDFAKERGIRTAVVTDDRIGRGIVTAVSWLGADIRAFSWADMEDAAAFLGVHSPDERAKVASLARALRRDCERSQGARAGA
jgi:hypothetical protein